MRSKDVFYFKQFSVRHDQCTMKVGTDAVLLGAWADTKHATRILDIGAGSGVISLMMAQRTAQEVHIDAVEILEEDATQARENIESSPWKERITVHQQAIQEFKPEEKYDLIISNPPFFIGSQAPPDPKRYQARHAVTLTYQQLTDSVVGLLATTGRFNVILPFTEGLHFIGHVRNHGLFCTRQYTFKSKKDKPAERCLLEFGFTETNVESGQIILYDHQHQWSKQYRKLTGDFYLYA